MASSSYSSGEAVGIRGSGSVDSRNSGLDVVEGRAVVLPTNLLNDESSKSLPSPFPPTAVPQQCGRDCDSSLSHPSSTAISNGRPDASLIAANQSTAAYQQAVYRYLMMQRRQLQMKQQNSSSEGHTESGGSVVMNNGGYCSPGGIVVESGPIFNKSVADGTPQDLADDRCRRETDLGGIGSRHYLNNFTDIGHGESVVGGGSMDFKNVGGVRSGLPFLQQQWQYQQQMRALGGQKLHQQYQHHIQKCSREAPQQSKVALSDYFPPPFSSTSSRSNSLGTNISRAAAGNVDDGTNLHCGEGAIDNVQNCGQACFNFGGRRNTNNFADGCSRTAENETNQQSTGLHYSHYQFSVAGPDANRSLPAHHNSASSFAPRPPPQPSQFSNRPQPIPSSFKSSSAHILQDTALRQRLLALYAQVAAQQQQKQSPILQQLSSLSQISMSQSLFPISATPPPRFDPNVSQSVTGSQNYPTFDPPVTANIAKEGFEDGKNHYNRPIIRDLNDIGTDDRSTVNPNSGQRIGSHSFDGSSPISPLLTPHKNSRGGGRSGGGRGGGRASSIGGRGGIVGGGARIGNTGGSNVVKKRGGGRARGGVGCHGLTDDSHSNRMEVEGDGSGSDLTAIENLLESHHQRFTGTDGNQQSSHDDSSSLSDSIAAENFRAEEDHSVRQQKQKRRKKSNKSSVEHNVNHDEIVLSQSPPSTPPPSEIVSCSNLWIDNNDHNKSNNNGIVLPINTTVKAKPGRGRPSCTQPTTNTSTLSSEQCSLSSSILSSVDYSSSFTNFASREKGRMIKQENSEKDVYEEAEGGENDQNGHLSSSTALSFMRSCRFKGAGSKNREPRKHDPPPTLDLYLPSAASEAMKVYLKMKEEAVKKEDVKAVGEGREGLGDVQDPCRDELEDDNSANFKIRGENDDEKGCFGQTSSSLVREITAWDQMVPAAHHCVTSTASTAPKSLSLSQSENPKCLLSSTNPENFVGQSLIASTPEHDSAHISTELSSSNVSVSLPIPATDSPSSDLPRLATSTPLFRQTDQAVVGDEDVSCSGVDVKVDGPTRIQESSSGVDHEYPVSPVMSAKDRAGKIECTADDGADPEGLKYGKGLSIDRVSSMNNHMTANLSTAPIAFQEKNKDVQDPKNDGDSAAVPHIENVKPLTQRVSNAVEDELGQGEGSEIVLQKAEANGDKNEAGKKSREGDGAQSTINVESRGVTGVKMCGNGELDGGEQKVSRLMDDEKLASCTSGIVIDSARRIEVKCTSGTAMLQKVEGCDLDAKLTCECGDSESVPSSSYGTSKTEDGKDEVGGDQEEDDEDEEDDGDNDEENEEENMEHIAKRLGKRLRELESSFVSAPAQSRRVVGSSTFASPDVSLDEKIDLLIRSRLACPTLPNYLSCNTYTVTSRFKWQNHNGMLADRHRVHNYQQAINLLAPNRRVLEIGTGPYCLLSLNAARAGAKSVLGVEVIRRSAEDAAAYATMYGFENVEVVHAYSKEFDFKEEKFDLIIHEVIGDFCSNEGVADVVLDIQERTGCIPRSIPYAARSFLCPVTFPLPRSIRYPHCKFSLRTIVSPNRKMLQSVGLDFQPLLLSSFQAFEELFFEEKMSSQMKQTKTLVFEIEKPGLMCGLLMTNEVEITKGLKFGTKHAGKWDHWYCNIILFFEEVQVRTGDMVVVSSVTDLTNYERFEVPEGSTLETVEGIARALNPEAISLTTGRKGRGGWRGRRKDSSSFSSSPVTPSLSTAETQSSGSGTSMMTSAFSPSFPDGDSTSTKLGSALLPQNGAGTAMRLLSRPSYTLTTHLIRKGANSPPAYLHHSHIDFAEQSPHIDKDVVRGRGLGVVPSFSPND